MLPVLLTGRQRAAWKLSFEWRLGARARRVVVALTV